MVCPPLVFLVGGKFVSREFLVLDDFGFIVSRLFSWLRKKNFCFFVFYWTI